jgi:hypothetical protein
VKCPVENRAVRGRGAFFEAIHAVQVEILKDKIRKTWGGELDKVADALMRAMGVQWQSILSQSKAQRDLREDIARIFYSQGK